MSLVGLVLPAGQMYLTLPAVFPPGFLPHTACSFKIIPADPSQDANDVAQHFGEQIQPGSGTTYERVKAHMETFHPTQVVEAVPASDHNDTIAHWGATTMVVYRTEGNDYNVLPLITIRRGSVEGRFKSRPACIHFLEWMSARVHVHVLGPHMATWMFDADIEDVHDKIDECWNF